MQKASDNISNCSKSNNEPEKEKPEERKGRDKGHVSLTKEHSFTMSTEKCIIPLEKETKTAKRIPLTWYLALGFMVLVYGSYGVLVNLSKVNGQLPFSSFALICLVETLKFVISSVLLYLEPSAVRSLKRLSVGATLPFAVPALLYTVNNNLAVLMQVHMDPATYQLLGNLKIVTTAVFYRLFLKRGLKIQQWASIGLLTSAGVCDSLGSLVEQGNIVLGRQHVTATGLAIMLTYCTISALAGVYTEFILKKDMDTSLHLQNITLYAYSILFNSAAWVVAQHFSANAQHKTSFDFFQGFSIYLWLVVFTQALNGLGMSAVFKYGSNLVRLFVISCAMIVGTTLSILVLGLSLNVLYFLTLFLIILAIYLYYR